MVLGAFTWTEFFEQVIAGLAAGAVYGSLALALVVIYRSTRVINFAQGEMATLTTYISVALIDHGLSFWAAFAVVLVVAFAGGFAIERVLIRPVENAPVVTIVMVTLGLALLLNGVTTVIWGGATRTYDGPFSTRTYDVGGVHISAQYIGIVVVSFVLVALLAVLFRFTKLGLALRAASQNRASSRLAGVRVGSMLGIGWGLAAVLGAVSGMMIAPLVGLEPDMMQTILLYAFAAAIVGGLDSPVGAVVGGLLLGLATTLAGRYWGYVDSTLKLPFALVAILVLLLVRPNGLFGRVAVRRV